MTPKILIIGSTGELGSSLLNYCSKNNIAKSQLIKALLTRYLNEQKGEDEK